jgi:hypothetical protein
MLDSHKKDLGAGKYEAYKTRAMFYNAVNRTAEGLSGMVFQRPPVWETSDGTKEHLKDITLAGHPADLFALRAFRETLLLGRFGILIDMTEDPEALPEGETPRPYWVGIRAEDIISWRSIRIGGDDILTRVVIRELAEIPDADDEFVVGTVLQYRVLELRDWIYTVTVFREERPGSDKWVPVEEIVPTRHGFPLDFIPFVFCGPNSIASEISAPPLRDLFDLALSHYRTMADLEHGRHLVALPTPWVSGHKDTGSGPLSLGPGNVWVLDRNGRAGMLEFQGTGLGALVTAEQDKRKMMAAIGARLLEDQPTADETFGAVSLRHIGETATIKTIASAVSQALTFALRVHVWWLTLVPYPNDLPDFCTLNQDTQPHRMPPDELRTWIQALQSGTVSSKTFFFALKKGDLMRPGVEYEEEMADIEEEQAALAELEAQRAAEAADAALTPEQLALLEEQGGNEEPVELEGPGPVAKRSGKPNTAQNRRGGRNSGGKSRDEKKKRRPS